MPCFCLFPNRLGFVYIYFSIISKERLVVSVLDLSTNCSYYINLHFLVSTTWRGLPLHHLWAIIKSNDITCTFSIARVPFSVNVVILYLLHDSSMYYYIWYNKLDPTGGIYIALYKWKCGPAERRFALRYFCFDWFPCRGPARWCSPARRRLAVHVKRLAVHVKG